MSAKGNQLQRSAMCVKVNKRFPLCSNAPSMPAFPEMAPGPKKFFTLQDLQNNSSDNSDSEDRQQYFTGTGDNSGMMIEGPAASAGESSGHNEEAVRLIRRAMEHQQEGQNGRSFPNASSNAVVRTISLYSNGILIEGEGISPAGATFHDYAQPETQGILAQLNSGKKPRELQVGLFEDVEIRLQSKQSERYSTSSGGEAKQKLLFVGKSRKVSEDSPAPTTSSSAPEPVLRELPPFPVHDSSPVTTLCIRCRNGKVLKMQVNVDVQLHQVVAYVAQATGMPNSTLASLVVPNLHEREAQASTIQELGLQNSSLVQK